MAGGRVCWYASRVDDAEHASGIGGWNRWMEQNGETGGPEAIPVGARTGVRTVERPGGR